MYKMCFGFLRNRHIYACFETIYHNRLFLNRADDDERNRPKKSKLEIADLSRMVQRSRDMIIHPGVRKIMDMLLKQME